MELSNPVQQFIILMWRQLQISQVLAGVTVSRRVVISELRLRRVRAQQCHGNERTWQPVTQQPPSVRPGDIS